MEIKKVQLQEHGGYQVNDNVFVPDDMANTHRVMIADWVDAGGKITPYVEPEKSWVDKRTAPMADGGYGTVTEQLEMIGEQGMDKFQEHIGKVKSDFPKT